MGCARTRGYVVANRGDPGAVLVFDEAGDIKQGTETVATARQHMGVTGQVENCHVAVFAADASQRGQALVDVELYAPEEGVSDLARCKRAAIPSE
jgi:SRSO17 transposase